jgi:tetratricopeptide (TPR) repeat protein
MTILPDTCDDAPKPHEIRAATERLIASDVFSRSPQLGAFLRFIVDAVLNGKGNRIKAYTIGVEVLRRDSKFDPQFDPIVRVEATRLRRAIERYYAGSGVDDSIIVDLPRGTYVPIFRRRDRAVRRIDPVVNVYRRWTLLLHQPPTLASVGAIAAIAVLLIAGVMLFERRDQGTRVAGVSSRQLYARPDTGLPPGNGMPTIQIEPFRVLGSPPPHGVLPDYLYAKISDAFARFDTVNVASEADAHADYRLSGTLEYVDDAANAWFTLSSSTEGKVVWSRTFEHVHGTDETGVTGNSIVISLTNSLLQSYGVIRARDRAGQLASNTGDARYRCILAAADAMRTADRRAHDLARTCLERLTAADPSFAVGLIFLSMMYSREFQLEYEPRQGDAPALDQALRTIRQAIALHPEDSRAYLALMVIQFNRRDIAGALAAGEKCMALNKYDMLALGEYGGRLILAGDISSGMKKLHEAGAHGAVRPAWHHIYLFIGSYIDGDMAEAVRHAKDIPNDNTALGQIARVLTAKAEGNEAELRKAIERLSAIAPGWRRDPQAELARVIADEGIVDRLARDLAAAGLSGETEKDANGHFGRTN